MVDDVITPEAESAPWLKMLHEADETYRSWQHHADNIDALYSDLERLAAGERDRQMQVFWANMQVVLSTTYSRAPVPVATSRFRDRKPLPRRCADLLERALIADFDADKVHDKFQSVNEDLDVCGRGAAWLRIGSRDGLDVPCLDHVDRKDFRHEPARKWEEVGWVARRGWMTKAEVQERFGRIPEGLSFTERALGDDKKVRGEKKAGIWELWHRAKGTMVFVAEGAKEVLEQRKPYMDLTDFFPCPRPAYGTVQRRTLIPVPDVVYYRDQLEEINAMTNRIAALTEALRVRGFYSAGIPDVADAIESAMQSRDDRAVMKAVASVTGTVSGESLKDAIVWLPTDMVAKVLEQVVALRKQLMEDVYEISGLSDIMRGNTDANETLGAQELKSQYGSIRIRRRQEEMVRVCRDVTRMKAEIMAENLKVTDLMVMAQVDDIPTMKDLMGQAEQINQQAQGTLQQLMQAEQQAQDPQAQQQIQQQAQQIEQQAQQALQQLKDQVTQEAIAELLQNQKLRPFALDIETDSTIQPDENAEKEKRAEFATATGQMINQIITAMQVAPQLAPFLSEALRFVASAFRPGRQMDDALDEVAEGLKNYQPPPQQTGEDPEATKAMAQAQIAKSQADVQVANTKAQQSQMELEHSKMEMQAQAAEAETKNAETAEKIKLMEAQIAKIMFEIGQGQHQMQMDEQALSMDAQAQSHDQAMQAHDAERADEQQAVDNKRADQEAKRADMTTKADVGLTQAQAKAAARPPKASK